MKRNIVANLLATFFDGQQQAGGGLIGMLPLLLLVPLLYFMLFRPQQKKQKQWQEMLTNLKQGDKVTTAGGIRGVIIALRDDVIVIRVAPDNLKLEVAKTAIAAVTRDDEPTAQS